LWGRFLTCGGLSIRLPPLYAPATTLENRQHRLRLCRYAGQDGILRGGWQPPLSLYSAKLRGYAGAGGRLKSMKKPARSNGRLELPLPGSPPSPLGRKLMRLRKKIEASGVKLLTKAEVDREVLRRRGLV